MGRTAQDIIDSQGWSNETLVRLYEQFIINQNSEDAFIEFLDRHTDEENSA